MTSVRRHYETHLAPIYVWMAGGLEHALALGAQDLSDVLGRASYAVDLGAGFGMHTIPLARRGTRVLALDTSELLLAELRAQSRGLEVEAVCADLLAFPAHLSQRPDLVLCMGDTLTHLHDLGQIDALLQAVSSALRPGGQFIATFRDYTRLPAGPDRFISVRSDAHRIHTCFLEEAADHVVVHDVIHERDGEAWSMRVSSYEKLRLSPDALQRAAGNAGLRGTIARGPRGMVELRAGV